MTYPREDLPVKLYIIDNSVFSGFINIAGIDFARYLQGPDPDIVLYGSSTYGDTAGKTLFVGKQHVLWIDPGIDLGPDDQPRIWRSLRLKLINNQVIAGRIDISGHDRLSDFLQNRSEPYYEIWDCSINSKHYDRLFIAAAHTLWKEPIEE